MDFSFIESASERLRLRATLHPELLLKASNLSKMYQNKRALMVIDVVASRQRHYQTQVKKIVSNYESEMDDLTLDFLAINPPEWLKLKKREPETISLVAQALVDYGRSINSQNDEETCAKWALLNSGGLRNQSIDPFMKGVLDIWGIGEVLLEYLRLLCGADTLKVDVRVMEHLQELGVPTELFTPKGLLEVCRAISDRTELSLAEIDQLLWNK